MATIAFGVSSLFLPLAIAAFGGPEVYFSLAIIAFGAFGCIVPKILEVAKREDRGLKVRFSLATIVFETFELILCQMLSSQGKNAPSNPYPHYLVRLATSRILLSLRKKWNLRSLASLFKEVTVFKGSKMQS